MSQTPLTGRDAALLALLQHLAGRDYRFTTPTPLTHARVIARADRKLANSLTDIFGWSLPFATAVAGEDLLMLMKAAGVLRSRGGMHRSSIRVSGLADHLFAHSAYPTLASDSIFFGPDTYRFTRFVKANLGFTADAGKALRCVDVGCGSGAGAISAARHFPRSNWLLADINPEALRIAAINARLAGITVKTILSDVLAATEGDFDLVICNPPYIADAMARAYRDGGGALGSELSLRIAAETCERLNPGGRLLLYTGVAIVDGQDPFLAELRALFNGRDIDWQYAEIDPDVFGEELEQSAYAAVDRIAAVGLVAIRRRFNWTADSAESAAADEDAAARVRAA